MLPVLTPSFPPRRATELRGSAGRGFALRAGGLPRRRRSVARRGRAPGRAGVPPAGSRAVKSGVRAWRIGRVLLRYRLDDLLAGTPAERDRKSTRLNSSH